MSDLSDSICSIYDQYMRCGGWSVSWCMTIAITNSEGFSKGFQFENLSFGGTTEICCQKIV